MREPGAKADALAGPVVPVGAPARESAIDEHAFRAMYDATSRPIWAYLYRTLGSAADADDLVQEVYLRYLRAPLATRDVAENRAYLFRIASNLAIDHWRRSSRRGAASGDSREDPPQGGLARRASVNDVASPDHGRQVALRADMAKTFRELHPRERTLLWLACVEGESPAAIAAALGVGRNSVPVLLFRARKKLAALLRRAGWEG